MLFAFKWVVFWTMFGMMMWMKHENTFEWWCLHISGECLDNDVYINAKCLGDCVCLLWLFFRWILLAYRWCLDDKVEVNWCKNRFKTQKQQVLNCCWHENDLYRKIGLEGKHNITISMVSSNGFHWFSIDVYRDFHWFSIDVYRDCENSLVSLILNRFSKENNENPLNDS